MIFKLWSLLVRVFIRPFIEAFRTELRDLNLTQSKVKLDQELLDSIANVSKERLGVLLQDKTHEEVARLRVEVEYLRAELAGVQQWAKKFSAQTKADLTHLSAATEGLTEVVRQVRRVHKPVGQVAETPSLELRSGSY